LEHWFVAHRRELTAYAYYLASGDKDIAEGGLGHAIEACVRHQTTTGWFHPPDRDPMPWVKTIIARRVIDGHRRHKRFLEKLPVLFDSTPVADPADVVVNAMVARQARALLQDLPPKYRAVAVLSWVDGLSVEQIAVGLGMKQSTVTTIRHRVVKKLRRELGIGRDVRGALNEGGAA
jgi:RNA polymerase sigma factor (sigma-70 family)